MHSAAPRLKKPDALQMTGSIVGAVCLFYVSLSWTLRLLFGFLLRLASGGEESPGWVVWMCNLGIVAACLLAAYLFMLRCTPAQLHVAISFAPVKDKRLFLFVPVFMGLVMLINIVTSAFSAFLQKHTAYVPTAGITLPDGFFGMLCCFLALCVVPAVMEEMLVRGLMQTMLMHWGVWFGIVVSSVAFTLLHGDIAQMPGIFLISVMLGLAAYCTRSLTAGMVLHFLNNMVSFLLLVIEQRLGDKALIAMSVYIIGLLVFSALACVALIYRTRLMRIFAPVPKLHEPKNRQSRVLRLARTPVYMAAMVLLAIRAFIPLWIAG